MKICSKCKLEKENDCFTTNKRSKDKLHYYCKACMNEHRKARGHYPEAKKRWLRVNKDRFKQYRKQRRSSDPEYNARLSLLKRNARKRRIARDPLFKISRNLRSRIWHALKGKVKYTSLIRDLGCSLEELKLYIESQFDTNMTWDNYGNGVGRWNIDHIKPVSAFDLSSPLEQRQINHYLNLRPLWSEENLKKSDSWV